jgi:NAD(P)-dependent dehydrogenase (short-subunit alcohol dehydrogenase family)
MEWYLYLLILFALFLLKRFFNGPFTRFRHRMDGKTIIITGATAGIGKESALQFLEDGAEVIFATRDQNKTNNILNNLIEEQRLRAHWIHLDLCSFRSVQNFVAEFKDKFEKIDILINNAGYLPTEYELTEDKVEICFQVNHLSHMYLSYLLLDNFYSNEGRIINVSSMIHSASDYTEVSINQLCEDKDFTNFKKYYNGFIGKNILYANTKIANVYFTSFLAELCEAKYPHIKSFSLHPGGVDSDFFRGFMLGYKSRITIKLLRPVMWFFLKSSKAGAQTQLDLCYRDIKELDNGGYFKNCQLSSTVKLAKDKKIRNALIDYSCFLIRNTGRKIELDI